MKKFSIVIPVYQNEFNLPITIPYIMEKIPSIFPHYEVELILVNDGSPDNSWQIMQNYQKQYPETIKIIKLTRNFGQGMALICGLEHARGDCVGVISCDLQDPFELFGEMVQKWEEGSKLVCATRESRTDKGIGVIFAKTTHKLVHKFINSQYPEGGFDFYLLDKEIIGPFCTFRGRNTSGQLDLLWFGHPVAFIPYERKARTVGTSSWTLSKKINAFINIFISNSYIPLRAMSMFGSVCAVTSFMYGAYIFLSALFRDPEQHSNGWSSLALLIIFFGGLTLISVGIIGEYIWRMLEEIRGKPLYVVEQKEGFQKEITETVNI